MPSGAQKRRRSSSTTSTRSRAGSDSSITSSLSSIDGSTTSPLSRLDSSSSSSSNSSGSSCSHHRSNSSSSGNDKRNSDAVDSDCSGSCRHRSGLGGSKTTIGAAKNGPRDAAAIQIGKQDAAVMAVLGNSNEAMHAGDASHRPEAVNTASGEKAAADADQGSTAQSPAKKRRKTMVPRTMALRSTRARSMRTTTSTHPAGRPRLARHDTQDEGTTDAGAPTEATKAGRVQKPAACDNSSSSGRSSSSVTDPTAAAVVQHGGREQAAGCAKQPEQPEQQQQQHAFLIPTQLERRAALARICHGFLKRIRLHGSFFDPREEVGSLRVSRVCALVNNCGPAASTAFVDVAWERISMLVTMAKAQQAKSPLLCNLAYVHTGLWMEAQVGKELKRGRGESAARQRVALSLRRDVGAIQRDDRGYRKLVASGSRWLAVVRTFSVGAMAILFQKLKIRKCCFSQNDMHFFLHTQLMFSAGSTCSARTS